VPVPRWTKYFLALLVVVAVLVGASFTAAAYTGRSSFCISCHEMDPYYDSWALSSHEGVGCAECHIPKTPQAFVKTKAFAFREIYVHLTKQVKAPLAVTRDIPDSTCTACHDALPPVELASSTFDHATHTERCITCHERVVHRSVTPPTYVDPATMDSCFTCHDGSTADKSCALCHAAPHDDMGKPCDACHSLTDWSPQGFTHAFPLTFAHAKAKCNDCHPKTATAGAGGFKLGKAPELCEDCHDDPHGGLTGCDKCHSPKGWQPANFRHPPAGEHSVGSGSGISCRECHPQGFGSVSCTCHGGNAPVGD